MPGLREPVRLQGFNNLTKVVSFNLYDFVVARTDAEREGYVRYLHERFNSGRITAILAEIARIIDADAVRRLAALIDPDKVVAGGHYDEVQRYFDPTVLYPVEWTDRVMQDEIFGPILPILTYSRIEEKRCSADSKTQTKCVIYIISRGYKTISPERN